MHSTKTRKPLQITTSTPLPLAAMASFSAVSTSSPSSHHAKGAPKFFSKIKHKIEDNFSPKLTGKLYKSSKHSMSMNSLPMLDNTTGKYTSNTSKYAMANAYRQRAKSNLAKIPPQEATKIATASKAACLSKLSYINSDEEDEDECQLSLNLMNQSLEDEIFQELEKVAHDEFKLNEVLQNFDKILCDHQAETETTTADSTPAIAATPTETTSSETTTKPHKLLTKQNSVPTDQAIDIANSPARDSSQPKKLEKAQTSLSLKRRSFYQSNDSIGLMQLRRAFMQSSKRSSSVWELSPNGSTTKIPISKYSSLRKRSNSCCTISINPEMKNAKTTAQAKNITSITIVTPRTQPAAPTSGETNKTKAAPKKLRQVTVSTTKSKSSLELIKPKISTNKEPNLQRSSSNCTLKRSLSSAKRVSRSSDLLLDKCLEKGQQLLRKVEQMQTTEKQLLRCKSAIAMQTPAITGKIQKDKGSSAAARKRSFLKKLNYADEESITKPPLESCKVIPPKLGETSDKHVGLLVPVKQIKHKQCRSTSLKLVQESVNKLAELQQRRHVENDSDSDDSGHISNDTNDNNPNELSTSTTSSASLYDLDTLGNEEGNQMHHDSSNTNQLHQDDHEHSRHQFKTSKVSALLAKFEQQQKTHPDLSTPSTPHVLNSPLFPPHQNQTPKVCTTLKIAQIEPFQCVQTQIEIFPTYTKEVTIKYY